MKKWILIITLMLITIPIVFGATVVQVSTDNATWTSIEAHPYYGTIAGSYGRTPYLKENTNYYFRVTDDTHDWTYLEQKTLPGGLNEMIITVGLIFIFLTSLLVFALVKANKVWLKTVLSLALSIMVMTLLRLTSWFVHIDSPTELELINTLDHFYMFGVWGFRIVMIGVMFIVLIIVLNSLKPKRKDTSKWDKWGEDE